ncbi:DEAD/DEAH box helicase [Limisphaera ngatamarikiensis]|uniref:DEAD/DEAH box helicase n=1 Tax=Limisphaera ngatamarikiensis TaxID=1324935 RepID=A0A6M1S0Z1_9BACT|nr:helicase-related protein [Limisphaera ngatamarikiensis]NGO39040.1 DEAD/DEAH box helicase [Limisphaera ngatamarikiensis]
MNPGSIVRCRNREWVLLPAATDDVFVLRPLTGTPDDVVHVHRGLANHVGYTLPFERVTPAWFPMPAADDVADAASTYLLWQAARLVLREGAAPFRSLGRISIRPRTYQFVPLLMALRLNPVRLFIADDVGVGKTIEALLIARELLDRGEIRRFCVLCPPYLCEQWARELTEKFNLEPVVIRSGTVGQLERETPPGKSIYEHFPVQVASIDFVKTDRNRHQFLQFCPELVIVDEVHGAAAALGARQQERHALLRELAKKPDRHLILLTATPHSGIEDAFRSLLGLLRPEFAEWNVGQLTEPQRIELARHFVQRTRRDIEQSWEAETCFPKREAADETYELSGTYRELFERTCAFCSEIVRTGEGLEERKRRVRYWGALALLRCVMSSPAAAQAALARRDGPPGQAPASDEAPEFQSFVFESTEDRTEDEAPTPAVGAVEDVLAGEDRRKLRELARLAGRLHGTSEDTKLQRAIEVVERLVTEGYHPIVWCRYIATAEYVAQHLHQRLGEDVQVVCVTGRMGDEEREARIAEIEADRPRVLVATDCLSEGVNLQEKFTAVFHYDLPWNPNRLEQREGRVDRYGQPARTVRAIRFFGRDNPVDGVVIEVLLDKAREIHRTLGTHVPVPEESESVMQAVLEALFLRGGGRGAGQQLALNLGIPQMAELHRRWERDVERERLNRTRFAQRALKPEEVRRELEATDAVLGDPMAVREFVLTAAQRIGLPVAQDPKRAGIYRITLDPSVLATLPDVIRLSLARGSPLATRQSPKPWLISFDSPTPEGAEYLGRNHRFVAALAHFLFEEALSRRDKATVSRCGAVRTRAVQVLTTLLLLRVRYLVEQPQVRSPLLSEEVLVVGFAGARPENAQWLDTSEALRLLAGAKPDANLSKAEKQELVRRALGQIGEWRAASGEQGSGEWGEGHPLQSAIRKRIQERAKELEESHKRIRQAVSLRVRGLDVKPQFPPDLLGLLVLQPLVLP